MNFRIAELAVASILAGATVSELGKPRRDSVRAGLRGFFLGDKRIDKGWRTNYLTCRSKPVDLGLKSITEVCSMISLWTLCAAF